MLVCVGMYADIIYTKGTYCYLTNWKYTVREPQTAARFLINEVTVSLDSSLWEKIVFLMILSLNTF